MSEKPEILISTGDYMVLQGLTTGRDGSDPLTALLRRKLDEAIVLFSADIGPEVVRLGSRVRYRAGEQTLERTLLARGAADGTSLPLLSAHGLALLGTRVGRAVHLAPPEGSGETLVVEAVTDAAEADPAPRPAAAAAPAPQVLAFQRRPAPAARQPAYFGGDDDDPGPSAA